jgi:hypothetical protein
MNTDPQIVKHEKSYFGILKSDQEYENLPFEIFGFLIVHDNHTFFVDANLTVHGLLHNQYNLFEFIRYLL